MRENEVTGTIILADEGFNSGVNGLSENMDRFISSLSAILHSDIEPKYSFHDSKPFRKFEVKIKPEIVTLRRPVDIALGVGTHVDPKDWNEIISRDDVVVLDTRNDYEFKNGTFKNAVNPGTTKFSELPDFVDQKLAPDTHKSVAMFCTGGIRCEKFAPYLRSLGFENVYQLDGGILKYLETVSPEESLWQGECFVFDERRTVDSELKKGVGEDYSLRGRNKVDPAK